MTLYKTMAMEFARYNRWQNEKVLAACTDLSDEARREDRGLFFGSIHNTLNHILYADGVFLFFFKEKKSPESFNPKATPWPSFDDLTKARLEMDTTIETLMTESDNAWFEEDVHFNSERHGLERVFPRAFMVSQMFNHQTHHRSQVTSALHGLGVDYGITDLPFNPYSQY